MAEMTDARERGRAQSVQRALAILEGLGAEPHEVGIVDLSQRVGLPVSTVHRLLATLLDAGFVAQNAETGKYRVGVRAFELGNAFLKQTQLVDVVRPGMRQLGAALGETVNLAIQDGYSAVYVEQHESDHMLKIFTRTGTRVPLYCTGVGKVMLAGFTDAELDTYLAATDLAPRTHHTIVDPESLRQHIEQVRCQGYAMDNEDFELRVRCVAAPVRNHLGETVAAMSVSGPLHRLDDNQIALIKTRLLAITHEISTQLGFHTTA